MKRIIIAVISVTVLILSACQPGVSKQNEALIASSTASMKTVVALSTLLADVDTQTPTHGLPSSTPISQEPKATPTNPLTLLPTSTHISTPAPQINTCNVAEYVGETIVDKTQMTAGTSFVKTWTVHNAGTCTWTKDYRLVFVSGEAMTSILSVPFVVHDVIPGDDVVLSVNMTAPATDGEHIGFWKLSDGTNIFGLGGQGKSLYIQIIVSPEVTGPFKVTSVIVWAEPTSYKGICGKHGFPIQVFGKIRTNKAGVVRYHWEANGGRIDSTVQQIMFYGADEITVTNSFAYHRGYREDWARIFIDYPNNEAFDRVEYNVECLD